MALLLPLLAHFLPDILVDILLVLPSFFLVLLAPTLYFLVYAVYQRYLSPLSGVPGPWFAAISPLWLTSHVARLRLCRCVEECFETYGPIVRVSPNKVVFRDLRAMREVYGGALKFPKSSAYQALVMTQHGGGVWDHAMSTADPAKHAARRRVFAGHYTSSNLARWQPEMRERVLELVSILDKINGVYALDVLPLFRALMIDINAQLAFAHRPVDPSTGTSTGSLAQWALGKPDALSTAINDFGKRGLIKSVLPGYVWELVKRLPHQRWKLLCGADKVLHEFVSKRVRELREALESGKAAPQDENERTSMVARMLAYTPQVDERDIIAEGMGHSVASSDTVSTTLGWMLWEISRRPEVLIRLRSEVDDMMPDPHTLPDISLLQRLPYLTAFVKEGLRLYGDAPSLLERVVPDFVKTSENGGQPFTLLGHVIPPGTIVATQAWSMSRTPHVFPSAETFLPDRWLSAQSTIAQSSHERGEFFDDCTPHGKNTKNSPNIGIPTPEASPTTSMTLTPAPSLVPRPTSPVSTPERVTSFNQGLGLGLGSGMKFGTDLTLSGVPLQEMDAHLIPFGTGSRVCVGQGLAQIVLRLVVAAVVRNFDIIAPLHETNARTMEPMDAFVIFPAGMECKLILRPRKYGSLSAP